MPQRISDNFEVRRPKLLDNKEGPWTSTAEAIAYITKDIRAQGQVVKVLDSGSIVEYWWKDGIEDVDLVAKSSGGGSGDMTKSVYDIDDDGVVDKSESTQIIVRNSTGSTLSKGKVVYLSGATGNRPNAVLASASSESTSSKTIGIVVANIANNSDGYVAVNGTLHDLNLNSFAAGDALWLSDTAGDYVANTPPAEPSHAVFIGYVARAHPTQGRMVLAIQNGYELTELHGVIITSAATNDFLYYASDGLWKNKQLGASDMPTGIDATKIGAGGVSNTEFGYLDGVTSAIQTQINSKQDTLTNPVTGTGTNNQIAAFNSTGSTITSLSTSTYPSLTELSYIKGLTSAIQTQLSGKEPTITSGTSSQFFKGDKTWATISASDIPSSVDATKTANGSVSNTEFQYLDGVTSSIQTQFGLGVVSYSAAVASITSGGNAAETTIQTLTIPAGAFKSGDNILLTLWGSRTTGASTGVNSTLTTRITNISGATVYSNATGNRHHNYTLTGRCLSDTSIIWWQNFS